MTIFSNKPSISTLFFLLLLCLADGVMISQVQASQDKAEHDRQGASPRITGKITELITTAGFTYVEIDTGLERVWVAGPGTSQLHKGEVTAFSTEMKMQDFHSKSLKRDFPVLYFTRQFFTGEILTGAGATEGSGPHVQSGDHGKRSVVQGELQVGDSLREMPLDGLNVEHKTFSDFKGKPLIINVWASWCGPCRAEMASLNKFAQRYNGKQLNIIGISTDDYRNRAEAFIEQTGAGFENFLDHDLQLEKMLGATILPLTVFVDDKGRVLAKVPGAREWDRPQIIGAIAELLAIELEI